MIVILIVRDKSSKISDKTKFIREIKLALSGRMSNTIFWNKLGEVLKKALY